MYKPFRNFFVLVSLIGLFFLTACTDAAKPVNVTKVTTPSPLPIQPGQDSHGHTEGENSPRISLADAKKAFDDGSAVFVDTHVKAAYDADHIKGAINVTVQDLDAKINTIPKGKKIIAYCS